MPKIPIGVESKTWLYQLAVVERLSVPKIAKLAGCGTWKVFNRMRRFGIPRNPVGYNLSSAGSDNYMQIPGVVNPFAGKTHSAKTRTVLSHKASVPKPYISGNRNGMYGRNGSSNPNWKGGDTPERQLECVNQQWKAACRLVRKRDKGKCRRCGTGWSGPRSLHVHHILSWAEYPSMRFVLRNLVLLCKDCHDWVHSNSNINNEWRGVRAFNSTQAILANV